MLLNIVKHKCKGCLEETSGSSGPGRAWGKGGGNRKGKGQRGQGRRAREEARREEARKGEGEGEAKGKRGRTRQRDGKERGGKVIVHFAAVEAVPVLFV